MDACDLAVGVGRVRRPCQLVGRARLRRSRGRGGPGRRGTAREPTAQGARVVTAVLFFAFSAITLGAAFAVILVRNPVHSALFLVLSRISVAGFFLFESA